MAKRAPRKAIFRKKARYEDGGNPAEVYLEGLTESSLQSQLSTVRSLADVLSDGHVDWEQLAWHQLRAQHVAALRGRLQKLKYAPSSANRFLSTLRSILKSAWRLELIDHETMERTMDVAPIRGRRAPPGRSSSPAEMLALFEACYGADNTPLGLRDAAILAMLYGTGMRRAEVAGLSLEDYDPADASLRVLGKGNKERIVFLPNGSREALDLWLDQRGSVPGSMFGHVTKSGVVKVQSISAQLIYRVVKKWQGVAGLEQLSPHDLRRTFIGDQLDSGVDIATVSRQAGHASVDTTARYDRRSEQTQKRPAERREVRLKR